MKKYAFRYLPLLMMSPLLMANSPAPLPAKTLYSDIEVVCEYKGVIDTGHSVYDVTVKNTGDGFALVNNSLYSENNGEHLSMKLSSSLFKNEIVGPGGCKQFTFATKKTGDFTNPTNVWQTETYAQKDESASFTNFEVSKISERDYRIDFNSKKLGDYYYSVVVEYEYDGQTYYTDNSFSKNGKSLSFYTQTDLDLDKLEVKNITAYRSNYKTYKGGIAALGFIIFISILLGLLIIPPAIIVPIMILTTRGKEDNIAN